MNWENISKYTKHSFKIYPYLEVTSTMDIARTLGREGHPEGAVVIASLQTKGRGRSSRHFHSPPGTGLYMTLLLTPSISAEKSLYITTAAATAVAQGIEQVANKSGLIKWVNDIFIDNRKVCGILTEGVVNQSGGLQYATLGIGVNLTPPIGGFPKDLQSIAGSVFQVIDPDTAYTLAARILDIFWGYYERLEDKLFYNEYKSRCFLIGKTVNAVSPTGERQVTVLDISQDFGLIVKNQSGETETLASGEVSIRL